MNFVRKYGKDGISFVKFYLNLKRSNFYVKYCWKGVGDGCGCVNVKLWLLDIDKWEYKF